MSRRAPKPAVGDHDTVRAYVVVVVVVVVVVRPLVVVRLANSCSRRAGRRFRHLSSGRLWSNSKPGLQVAACEQAQLARELYYSSSHH